jgi:hypothetical protein
MARCPNCNSENPSGARFCGVCGASLAAPPPTTTTPVVQASPTTTRRQRGWVGTLLASLLAVAIAIAGALLYTDARSDLRDAKTSLAASQERVRTLNTTISQTRGTLSKTKDDLATSNQTARTLGHCVRTLFGAWFNTTHLSYTATGLAVQRAVYSHPCQIPRLVYQKAT